MATTTYHDTTTSNSTTTEFPYTFDVIKKEDVKVSLNGETQTNGYTVNRYHKPQSCNIFHYT